MGSLHPPQAVAAVALPPEGPRVGYPVLLRSLFAIAVLCLLVLSYFSYTVFSSRYSHMRATWGVHGQQQFEERVIAAIEKDRYFGEAQQDLAHLMMRRGRYAEALELQRKSLETYAPYKACEQMGIIQERLGRTDIAEKWYQQAHRLHPEDVRPIERLALLAVRRRDSALVQRLTREILQLDINNLNAYYLRAKDAELSRQFDSAILNYQKIAAVTGNNGKAPENLIFRPEEIRASLAQLKNVRAQ